MYLQHHAELVQERDKQIVALTKRYNITGYESAPFSSDQCAQLLSITKALLQELKDRINQLKVC